MSIRNRVLSVQEVFTRIKIVKEVACDVLKERTRVKKVNYFGSSLMLASL